MDGSLLHYVVIHKVTKEEILIADPAKFQESNYFKEKSKERYKIEAKNSEFEKNIETNRLQVIIFDLNS